MTVVNEKSLVAVADAIRAKTGEEDSLIFPEGFVSAIESIGGGIDGLADGSTTSVESECLSIRQYAFAYCEALKSVAFPNCTTIGSNAFIYCSALSSVSIPSATSIGSSAFMQCRGLKTIEDLDNVTEISGNAFRYSYIETLTLPSLKSISSNAFSDMNKFKRVDFGSATTFAAQSFLRCNALETVIIRSNTMATASSNTVFSSTSINSGTGYIYVHSALVATYQADANWSAYSAQFRAIEDYPDITGG